MACAALKRPYNFDVLSPSTQQLNSSSPKRQRCGTVAVSVSTSSNVSPFLSATPKFSRGEASQHTLICKKKNNKLNKFIRF